MYQILFGFVIFSKLGPVALLDPSLPTKKIFFLKNGPFPASFSLFSSFLQTVNSKHMFNKSCRWLNLNPGPLVLEATTLPTAPQPLPQMMSQFLHQNLDSSFCFQKLGMGGPLRFQWTGPRTKIYNLRQLRDGIFGHWNFCLNLFSNCTVTFVLYFIFSLPLTLF